MAIFNQIPEELLGSQFKHYGWFCGICPVYIGNLESEAPVLVERNWVPEWWLSFTDGLFGAFTFFATLMIPDYEPMYPIRISGEFKQ